MDYSQLDGQRLPLMVLKLESWVNFLPVHLYFKISPSPEQPGADICIKNSGFSVKSTSARSGVLNVFFLGNELNESISS